MFAYPNATVYLGVLKPSQWEMVVHVLILPGTVNWGSSPRSKFEHLEYPRWAPYYSCTWSYGAPYKWHKMKGFPWGELKPYRNRDYQPTHFTSFKYLVLFTMVKPQFFTTIHGECFISFFQAP